MNGAEDRFRYRVEQALPPLAWLAQVDGSLSTISVVCGTSVRTTERGFFEGTWVGPANLDDLPRSTTVFGSGIVLDDGSPLVVTPAHTISGVFAHSAADQMLFSNSLTAVLVATGGELEPAFDYPAQFVAVTYGIGRSPITIATSSGTVDYHFYSNLRIGQGLLLTPVDKPREAPFTTFGDYRSRLSAAVGSALSNAAPYESVVSVSSGYDSTAVAAIAAENGCRRAFTFAIGRRTRKTGDDLGDSGEKTAGILGMEVETFDRRAYATRDDLPEAEFLATGFSGEDVVMSAFGERLKKTVLLTGTMGNGIWRLGGKRTNDMSRSALDGASLQEFRLRSDFHFVPPAVFGQVQRASVMDIAASDEMRPFSVGRRYDQPIPRRIAEEAGIPRGSFAVTKHAASALIHSGGETELAPTTAAAIRSFAASVGADLSYQPATTRSLVERAALRGAISLGMAGRVRRLEWRRKRLVHFEPALGNLLLRWAVSVVRPRYEALSNLGEEP